MKNYRFAGIVLLGLLMVLISGVFCFVCAEAEEEELKPEEYNVEFGDMIEGERALEEFMEDVELVEDEIQVEHLDTEDKEFEIVNKEEDLYKRYIRWGQTSIVYGPCRANIITEGDEITELYEVGRFPQNFRNRKCGYMFRLLDAYADEPLCEMVTFEWPGAYDYNDKIIFCVATLSD